MNDFYFYSDRLEMGGLARFIVRLVSYISYGVLVASVFVLIFAELRWMQSLGAFFVLFLVDRLLHLNQGDESFAFLSESGCVNLDKYLLPSARTILEKASEKAIFLGGDIFLRIEEQCLEQPSVRKLLIRNNVLWKEAKKIIITSLKEDSGRRYRKGDIQLMLEPFIKKAALLTITEKKKFIGPTEIFSALREQLDNK